MKIKSIGLLIFLILFGIKVNAQTSDFVKPIVDDKLIFNVKNGIVAVEAEYFYKQSKSEVRQWYRTSKNESPFAGRDDDGKHCAGASNNAYLEILPDTRVTHSDKLIEYENFGREPGKLGILHYKVNFDAPGRYYVWVRAFSVGSEDNGIHVGIDGEWPEHGKRMQWCKGKKLWKWESMQRTEEAHCGVPKEIYLDIKTAGVHDIQFCMREDGFEFDKFIMTSDSSYIPEGLGPEVKILSGKLPAPFPKVEADAIPLTYFERISKSVHGSKSISALKFPVDGTNFYKEKDKWLAIDPEKHKGATSTIVFDFESNVYDLVFVAVGENDGKSTFQVLVNGVVVGNFSTPLSKSSFEEGLPYNELWENISLNKGDKITVIAKVGSEGAEFSRGRWAGIIFAEATKGKVVLEKSSLFSTKEEAHGGGSQLTNTIKADNKNESKGEVVISGELKQWHKVTLTLDGPFAKETDTRPNPFTDYRMTVTFTHESGVPSYKVPAYFAADGNAAETSAKEGNKWRAHLSPDKTGKWNYSISFLSGAMVATAEMPWMKPLRPFDGVKGSFEVKENDKKGIDLRAKGRLQYVGKHHLQFKGNGQYFYKAGADAPETLLGYIDFDNTVGMVSRVPLKKFESHIKDYKAGDPTWKAGRGKGLIGAINYLAEKGVNAFSFLTYNAGGDGDNVWPFISRNEKYNYDCSKLDQWQIVFDHAQTKGMYLHFKTQETENDDMQVRKKRDEGVPEALDGGEVGPERRLYYRELIARYGYLLALNWNLGEENTQTTEAQKAMANYFKQNDPYGHNVVLHTFPKQQEQVYKPLLGNDTELTGISLQNEWDDVFHLTHKWVSESAAAGKPWVVANDEQGSAGTGVPPDPGYNGFDASKVSYTIDDVRKQTLWGNIMAGGAGVEYYFGYKLPENDLVMEDFRSRDKSWDYCSNAINFLEKYNIPFHEMKNRDDLIGNAKMNKDKHCLVKQGEIYLVYLAYVSTSTLDLTNETGDFTIQWYNPVSGGKLLKGSVKTVKGGGVVDLGKAPSTTNQDWLVVVMKK